MARPSKYDPIVTPQLAKWMARNGLIDEQIAEELQIDVATLYRWKKIHPEFCESLKKGKDYTDSLVEDSLLQRALGYDIDVVEEETTQGTLGTTHKIKRTVKHIPADVTAQIFWLKNRQPERWRDVQRQEHTGANGGPIKTETTAKEDLSHYTTEELLQMQVIHETANARRNKQGTG